MRRRIPEHAHASASFSTGICGTNTGLYCTGTEPGTGDDFPQGARDETSFVRPVVRLEFATSIYVFKLLILPFVRLPITTASFVRLN
jgi:hypothetical protein